MDNHLTDKDRAALRLAAEKVTGIFLDELQETGELRHLWNGWNSYIRELSLIAIMLGEAGEDLGELRDAGWRIYRMLNHPHNASDLV